MSRTSCSLLAALLVLPLSIVAPGGSAAILRAPVAADAPSTASSTVSRPQLRSGFLGYAVGEERRYVLGPAEDLFEGESAWWTIHLDRVEETEEGPRGTFVIEHERSAPTPSTQGSRPYPGQSLQAHVTGEVTVNAHGFPIEVRYTAEASSGGGGSSAHTVQYVWEERGFTKRVWQHPKDWEIRIGTRGHENLEREVPRGAWPFLPGSLYCQELMGPAVAPSRRGATGALTWFENCRYDEPAFLHPGFLDLAMPMLREAPEGEWDYLFFKPQGPMLSPGTSIGIPFIIPPQVPPDPPGPGQPPAPAPPVVRGPRPTISGVGIGPPPGASHKDATDPLRYFEPVRLGIDGPDTIEVARRRIDATRVSFEWGLVAAWLDAEGTVVALQLPPIAPPGTPGTGVMVTPGKLERHIRRLFPSEY